MPADRCLLRVALREARMLLFVTVMTLTVISIIISDGVLIITATSCPQQQALMQIPLLLYP